MFRTELMITPQAQPLARTARVLTVGSCFAESLGERLRQHKVAALVNPFGTVFQPLALAQLLRAAAGEAQDWQQHLVEARGRWQSYDFHGTIGAESPVELLQLIETTVRQVGDFVRTADVLVLTLGTAWAYRLRETGELVNNLHKMPAALFEKELLTADEVVNALAEIHASLRRLNPELRIVLTVSPVRHLKDTLPLNAVSKSVLRVACHYLSELLPGVSYFPAYELLTDDLRDYRFYAADMLHPSDVAQDYIWERFARAYFDADFGRFRKEWEAVRQALGHRPLHPGAPEHRAFLDQTAERLARLTGQGVDVRTEARDVQRQLAALPPPRPARVLEVELADDGEERIDIGGAELEQNTMPISAKLTSDQETAGREERRGGRRGGRGGRGERGERSERERSGRPVATDAATGHRDSAETTSGNTTAAEAMEPVTSAASVPVMATELPVMETAGPQAEALLTDENGYPAKKKKRRSRGGAKRTARKNAARQADGPVGNERPVMAVEQAADPTETSAQVPIEPKSDGRMRDSATKDKPITETGASGATPVPTPAATDPVRKRGTGPTPKKSKVIAKTSPVKRAGLNSRAAPLYRPKPGDINPATAPMYADTHDEPAAVETTAAVVTVQAVEPTLTSPSRSVGVAGESAKADEAAVSVGLDAAPSVAAPAKPRRGRPKAARPAAAEAPAVISAPDPAPASESAERNPATGGAGETNASVTEAVAPASSAASATKARRTAKKVVTAKTDSTEAVAKGQRGRPPGKKVTADAENPAT